MELTDGGDEHHTIQHRDSADGNQTDDGRHGKGHAAEPECSNSADSGERHTGKDDQCVAERVEAGIQEAEDQHQHDGNDEVQAAASTLQVLELSAPLHVIARLPVPLNGGDLLLCFVDKRFNVPARHITHHGHTSASPFAFDDRRPWFDDRVYKSAQRQPLPAGRDDRDVEQFRRIGAVLRSESNDEREAAIADTHIGDRQTGDSLDML